MVPMSSAQKQPDPGNPPCSVRKHFQRLNEPFICLACGHEVLPHPTSSRDHCPHCLVGLHVDEATPGDRLSRCQGFMHVIAVVGSVSHHDGLTLLYRCERCNKQHRNAKAPDDDMEALAKIVEMLGR